MSVVDVALGLTVASCALYSLMMTLFARALLRRARARNATVDRAPRVTIFKPLAGCDDDLEDNLESFAFIDYPSFEILFGVADSTDLALRIVRRFVARHPKVDVRVVITDPHAAINPKVAQLVGLERVATGEVFVISDSNVRVTPRYLWSLVAELEDERVGVVTSLFAGTGELTFGAALENLQLCASTAPGIAALDTVSNRPFTVGKSMAVRRRDLARLGGFRPVGSVLAEDHVLGRRFLDAGFVARTSLDVVENRNVRCSVIRTLERHTRWAKMRRSLYPAAFAAEPVLTPILVASVGALVAPSRLTVAVLGGVFVAQTAWAWFAVRLVRGKALAWKYVHLEIARSYIAFMCWLCACVSRRIIWRGHVFVLHRGSVIVPIRAEPETTDQNAGLVV